MEDIFSYVNIQKEEIEMDKENLSLATSQQDHKLLPLSDAATWDGSIFEEGIQVIGFPPTY
jgi:hypothetical protein